MDAEAEAEADANGNPTETASRPKGKSIFASTRSLGLTGSVATEAAGALAALAAGELAIGAAAPEPLLGRARVVPAVAHSCLANTMVSDVVVTSLACFDTPKSGRKGKRAESLLAWSEALHAVSICC